MDRLLEWSGLIVVKAQEVEEDIRTKERWLR
jgi:hypothetical protein